MTDLHAPYNFVPLSSFVWLPEWAPSVSHDLPFQDGWCGEIEIELTAQQPLLVGGGDEARREDNGVQHVSFFRTRDRDEIAIPGSSLRGALRSVVEIGAFARMALADDRRLGVRDLTRGVDFYNQRMTGTVPNRQRVRAPATLPGWLTIDGEGWTIQPCRYARVSRASLASYVGTHRPESAFRREATWQLDHDEQTFAERYGAVEGLTAVRFTAPEKPQIVPGNADVLRRDVTGLVRCSEANLSEELPPGQRVGHLVVTGPVGSKEAEFLFFGTLGARKKLSPETVRAFEDINDHDSQRGENGDSPWQLWKQRWRGGLCGPRAQGGNPLAEPGIPVFYLEDDNRRILAFGLALMFKLPYDLSIGQVIGNTSSEHRNLQGSYDFAETVFGTIREQAKDALRGRISVGMARLAHLPGQMAWKGPYVLASPKPSYYPAYIRQPDSASVAGVGGQLQPGRKYATYMRPDANAAGAELPEIRGWKRYPVRNGNPPPAHAQAQQATQRGRAIGSLLETAPVGTRFRATLQLHNLRPAELGGLLWALRFGDRALASEQPSKWRHALGMGKPLGLGHTSIRIVSANLRPNDPAQLRLTWQLNGGALPTVLEQWMDTFEEAVGAAYASAIPGRTWQDSEQVVALRTMANPAMAPSADALRYMTLEVGGRNRNDFAKAKERRLVLPRPVMVRDGKEEQQFRPRASPEKADFAPRSRVPDDF